MNADTFAWAPLCIGVTAAGLVLSWFAWRRRGAGSGMRGAAYSLLPLGLYLTGVIPLLWRIGTQIVRWAAGLIFNPAVWAGTIVLGVAVLLWVVSGMMLRHKVTKSNRDDGTEAVEGGTGEPGRPAGTAAKRPAVDRTVATGQSAAAGGDDDMKDIEELLRRRGIQ